MPASPEVRPLDGSTFGATVCGITIGDLGPEAFAEIYEAWITWGLLIFPDQFLTRDEQNAFARRFGELEFEAAPISNVTKGGTVHADPSDDLVKSLAGNQEWHFDSTYMPVQAKGAVFTAEIVPADGADTGWADMGAAYEALDDDTRSLVDTLEASHSLYYSQGRAGLLPAKQADGSYSRYGYHDKETPRRPLTKTHPVTGRTCLLIGRHAHNIVGMDPDQSTALLDKLNSQACQPPRTYFHRWTEGDAVIWDNRRLMHRGVPWDMHQPRRMWHTRIAGDPATERALNH